MRIAHYLAVAAMGISVGANLLPKEPQDDKLTATSLKNTLEGLGFEVKTLNAEVDKEKYQISMKSSSLDIPVAFEISPSSNYIWMTVFLGVSGATTKHEQLLKENFNTQPTFFYITTKGNLMAGQAIDNRAVAPGIIKRCLEKIITDVDKTAKVWGN